MSEEMEVFEQEKADLYAENQRLQELVDALRKANAEKNKTIYAMAQSLAALTSMVKERW